MSLNKPILVFEHSLLSIGDEGFTRHHWEALGWYNEKHKGCFFSLTPKGVKFNQYVGVIQVGNITIEILPKISRTVEKGDQQKWQKVLIDMLRECSWMQIHAQEKAALRFRPNSILEAYLELFIRECEDLIRQGLIKKYRTAADNCSALKGKLLFHKQIQVNAVHKERFYTQHQVFDRDNIFNQLLLKALRLIPKITQSPFLKDRVSTLLMSFPELSDITATTEIFQKLVFDRKSAPYREAIEIAAMLLLNYRPDISSGQNHVLAILFDMNDLWEEYIFRQLYKNKPLEWSIKSQNSRKFWKLSGNISAKTIRPDIVLQNLDDKNSVVLDTKWKLPDNNIPADADLKQMFVYNEYWQAKNSLLVYPNAVFTDAPIYHSGTFEKKGGSEPSHHCGIMKIAVLDKDNKYLDKTVGKRINEFLEKEIMK